MTCHKTDQANQTFIVATQYLYTQTIKVKISVQNSVNCVSNYKAIVCVCVCVCVCVHTQIIWLNENNLILNLEIKNQ